MDFSNKCEFLYQSISDIQQTIRAIDVKIGFMFVVLLLPLAVLDEVYAAFLLFYKVAPCLMCVAILVVVIWVLSFYFLIKGVVALTSPAGHVSGGEGLKGDFYGSGLYDFQAIDAFINFPIKSKECVDEFVSRLPSCEEQILRELVFEKMKLTYIRDIKILRSSYCMYSSFLWLFGGLLLWIAYKFVGV